MIIRPTEIVYHRNGCSGVPFHVVKFDWKDDEGKRRHMIATVFDQLGSERPVAVFDLDFLAKGNIKFGENSWRGDDFAEVLYKAIDRHTKDRAAEFLQQLTGAQQPTTEGE